MGEARDKKIIKGDDSGCGRPPAVVAPPSPPSELLALDPPISVGRKAPSCRDKDDEQKLRPTLATRGDNPIDLRTA